MTTAPAREQWDYFRTTDRVRLRVLAEGPADAPVTVVLAHGWTLSKHTWDRVARRLPEVVGSALRTVRFDLRGHGESDPAPAGTNTIAQCADDLAALIAQRVPTGPIVLVGHSMGGMTLMALAQRHPRLVEQRVAAAAFVASSTGDLARPRLGLPTPAAEIAQGVERAATGVLGRIRGRRLTKRARTLRPGLRWLLFGRQPQRRDLADTATWVSQCQPVAMAEFRRSLAMHDRVDALAAFDTVPTLVLAGFADRLTPYGHARKVADALPRARLIGYGGAGHMLPLERTEEVTERLATLLRPVLRPATSE